MQGKATNTDKQGTYRTMSIIEVFKYCHISPMFIELRVKRPRMIQASVKYPSDYDQWLTALFGSIQFENTANREQSGELEDVGHLVTEANPVAK
eukprot:2212284-Pyramimonas_sp.AAC.1